VRRVTKQPARRSSDARRPDIGLDVARIGAVCVAAEAEHPSLVTARQVADAVDRALRATPASAAEHSAHDALNTNRSLIVQAAVAFTHRRCLDEMDRAAGELQPGSCSNDLRGRSAQLAALHAAGIPAADLDDGLRSYRRRVAVKALHRLWYLQDAERSIRAGRLREVLCSHFDTTQHEQRPVLLAQLHCHGIDSQSVIDAAVHFEAGRHINLVKHQANRMARSYPHYRPEDLFGWGWRGLVVALRNYDPERFAFSTYACVRIKGAIQDGARAESPIPKRLGTYRRRVHAIEQDLGQRLGRDPSADELAAAVAEDHCIRTFGRPPTLSEIASRIEAERQQLLLLPRLQDAAPLDELAHVSTAAVHDGVDDTVLTALRAQAVRDAVAGLPAEEAEAVRMLDLEELSLDDAARVSGATQRQLRSRRQRGRVMLEAALAEWV
jgi:RNA polymerase sigma factor FliA